MRDHDELFAALARSAFRARFRLGSRERHYLRGRGMATVMEHAAAFVATRLAPAHPTNDGRQTPMRNHPVFVAQHATATCCRGCLAKWHRIPRGRCTAFPPPADWVRLARLSPGWPHLRGRPTA